MRTAHPLMQLNKNTKFNEVGACVGGFAHENVVQFVCNSLSGGPTDTHSVWIEFPTNDIARMVVEAIGK